MLIQLAVSFVVSWFIESIGELPFDAIIHRAEEAAQENAREFEAADANSINAWKYFPW